MQRRNYRNSLEFIESGFVACWRNGQALVSGAKQLIDGGNHALALSLSVLALEELGKALCLDGLLFARPGDEKSETFARSLKSHSTKLSAFVYFPYLLGQMARVDPRYKNERKFGQAIAITVADLKDRGNVVLSLMKDESFSELDRWKQAGFYAQPRDNGFIAPSEAVSAPVAQAVYQLAWRAVTTFDFLLKDGNLERYTSMAREIRAKLSESDHAQLEQAARQLAAELFSDTDQDSVGQTGHA